VNGNDWRIALVEMPATPDWQRVGVDLGDFANQPVSLRFAVSSENLSVEIAHVWPVRDVRFIRR
jgi:hypothetical protein